MIDAEGYDGNIVIDFLSNSSLRPIIVFEYIHIKNKLFDTFKKCESKLLRPDIEINRSSINEDKINEDKIEKIIKSHYGDNIEIEFVEDNDSENSDSDCNTEYDYFTDEELEDKINNEFNDYKFTISTSRTLHTADNFN